MCNQNQILDKQLNNMENLRIVSYNNQGHGSGRLEYLQKLCDNNDIIFVQEHWLSPKELTWFENNIPTMNSSVISDVDLSEILYGHPYGGIAIL